MTRADTRPRVHLWPSHHTGWAWSIGPCGRQSHWDHGSPGEALDRALASLSGSLLNGAVIIVEPLT
jgi:hypothetical protein